MFRFVAGLLLFILIFPAFAQEVDETVEPESANEVIQPKEVDPDFFPREESAGSGLIWSVYLFLFMLVVLAGIFIYLKRGGVNLKGLGDQGGLKIKETKTLGNKQFLVVVEYESKKVLLGIGPGMMTHLCDLDSPTKSDDFEGYLSEKSPGDSL